MRTKLAILFVFLTLTLRAALPLPATVNFALTNFNVATASNVIQLYYTQPTSIGNYISIGLPIRVPTSLGLASTQLLAGTYEMKVAGITFSTNLFFTVPNDGGTYNVASLLTNGVYFVTNSVPYVVQLLAGSGITLSPSSGFGNVTVTSMAGSQTNIAVTGVTNAGTAAYSNASAFALSTVINFTNGGIWYVATNGNDATAVKGSRERPMATVTNAVAQSVAGDTIRVTDYGPYYTSNSWRLADDSWLDWGKASWTNAMNRAVADPQDLTVEGIAWVIGRRNCLITGGIGYGKPTVNQYQNSPAYGNIYFDKSANAAQQTSCTNFVMINVETHGMQGLYLRHTNGCYGKFYNDRFVDAPKQAGFISYGPHELWFWDCSFIAVGPDPIPNDSGWSTADGLDILSGTNHFFNCHFGGYNPTSYVASASPPPYTNAAAVRVNYGETPFPVAYFVGCTFDSGNTNTASNTNSFDILNGTGGGFGLNEPGLIYLSGCKYNPAKVSGPLTLTEINITGGVTSQGNTNYLVVLGAGSGGVNTDAGDLGTVWSRDIAISSPLTYSNTANSYIQVSGTCTMYEEFGSVLYTAPTITGTWSVAGIGSAPAPVIRYLTTAIYNSITLVSPNTNLVAGSFAGDGSSLTALNASQLASGTVPFARIAAPVLTNRQSTLADFAAGVGLFSGQSLYLTNSGKYSQLGPWTGPGQSGVTIYATNGAGALTAAFDVTGTNVIADHDLAVTGNLQVSALTASRVVLSDASKNASSAAASGAVPIDADGTATTFAQVNALAPGTIATNGMSTAITFSNNVTVDPSHKLYATNVGGTMQGGSAVTMSTASTTYWGSFGGVFTIATTAGSETNVAIPNPWPGTAYVRNLKLFIGSTALGSGTNVTATVYTNGIASNLSATLTGDTATYGCTNNGTTLLIGEGTRLVMGISTSAALTSSRGFMYSIVVQPQ